MVIVADESEVFGDYLPYRNWDPRPVVGTSGLVPTSWHRSQEQWGGTQLQRRFMRDFNRWMLERDYAAWEAVRSIGEAVTRTNSGDAATLHKYIMSDTFELAAFKGKPLTYRKWDQQLRQPILLATPLDAGVGLAAGGLPARTHAARFTGIRRTGFHLPFESIRLAKSDCR